MEFQPDKQNDSPKSGLNLKSILICSAIFGLVVFGTIKYTDFHRESLRLSCLDRFQLVNKALTMYRADFDGYSPFIDTMRARKGERNQIGDSLQKYAEGKVLGCPTESIEQGPSIRVTFGRKVVPKFGIFGMELSAFGIEDTSVVSECLEHIKYKTRFELPGTSWINRYQERPVSGNYNVLLRNGTAKSVPFSTKLEHWISRDGEFKRLQDRPKTWTGGYGNSMVFDFEPKPPQFER